MLQQLAVRFPPLSVKTGTKGMSSQHLYLISSVQGSGPFSTIGWIARTLGTEDE